MLLTASHVIGGLFPMSTEETQVVGYGDLQSEQEHDTITAPVSAITVDLGRLERSVPPDRAQRCTVDAAIARVSSDRELDNQLGGQPIAELRDIREMFDADITVRMCGARSKVREGILNTAPISERLRLGQSGFHVFYERACYIRSLDEEPFAIAGDSGSIVLDEGNHPVAMIVGLARPAAEQTPFALATPLVPVLEALDVELYAGLPSVTTPPVYARQQD
jgi:hypothetical protein